MRSRRSLASGIVIVEDAAHAVETTVRDRKVGSIGDFTCFSLYATKSLAGGEGGIATMSDDAAAATMRLLRAQGITRDPWQRCRTAAWATTTSSGRVQGEPGRPAGGGGAAQARPDRRAARPPGERWSSATTRASPELAGIEPIDGPPIGVHAHHLYIVRVDPALAGATATVTPRR